MTKSLAFLALACLTAAASAQSSVVAYSRSYIAPSSGWGGYGSEDDRGRTTASTDLKGNAGQASGSAWGDFGGMHTRGQLEVGAVDRAMGFGRLDVYDSLNIVSPGMTGRGTIVLSYSLTGAVNVQAAQVDANKEWYGSATCTAVIRANNGIVASNELQYQVGTYHPNPHLEDYFGQRTVEIGFDFGRDFWINTTVSSSAYLQNAVGSAVADFGSTFKWTGVAAVYDAQGNALTDFSAMGGSGLDYRSPQAVPEPGTLAAIGAGIVGLLKRQKR